MKPWIIWTICIVLCIILIVVFFILVNALFNLMFTRKKREIPLNEVDLSITHYKPVMDMVYKNMEQFMSLPFEDVYITSQDGLRLHGRYYKNQDSEKTLLFCHGYHADPFNNINTPGLWMLEAGYNILLITERSHGQSDGKYITFGVKESQDILLWNAYLNQRYHPKSIVVWGVSMGCAAVEMASNRFSDNVTSLVLDCGFTGAYEMISYSIRKKLHFTPHLLLLGLALWCRIKGHFKLEKSKSIQSLRENKIPSIFIHGINDQMVPYFMGEKNYQSCTAKKEFISIDCGHALSVYFGFEEYKEKVLHFLEGNTK